MSDLTGAPNDCFLWNICLEKQIEFFVDDRSIHVQTKILSFVKL